MAHMRLAALLALLLSPGLAGAQVFKCTGKDGRVTYSQTKPRDEACAETAPRAAPPVGTNVDALMKFSKEIDKSRGAENEARERAEQEQAVREARCKQARARLALIDQSTHVFTMDEKGERHYGTAAQRDQVEDAARQSVARECG